MGKSSHDGKYLRFLRIQGGLPQLTCSSLVAWSGGIRRRRVAWAKGGFRDLQEMQFRGDDCISSRRSALSGPVEIEKRCAAESGTGDRRLSGLRIFAVYDRAGMVIRRMVALVSGHAGNVAEEAGEGGTTGPGTSKERGGRSDPPACRSEKRRGTGWSAGQAQ
jgi:hypothetical protein